MSHRPPVTPPSAAPTLVARLVASRWAVVLALVLAAALRVAHVLALRHSVWFDNLVVDPEYYDAWARRIAAGEWMGDRAFYMDPLYPYVLAVLYRIWGRDLLAARLLNVVCSVAACGVVAGLGRRLGGGITAVIAALGLALYKPDVFYVGELDKTSLSVLLSAATLALAFGRSLAARFAAGVALALTALTRANFLVFAPFAALAFAYDPRDRVTRIAGLSRGVWGAALFTAGFAVTLSPVVWHNHRASGGWALTTTQLGQNFYTGNNPTNPYGAYGVVPFVRANPHFEEADFRAEAEARAQRPLGAGEVSAFWLREALAHLRADPAFAARAFARKLVLFWNDFEISDSQDQYLLERDSPVLRLPLLGFGAIAPFALLGAIAHRGRRRVRLLVAFVGLYWLALAAFFLFSRYRVQVLPALVPLAALGVVEAFDRIRSGDLRRIAAASMVLAGAALFCFQSIGLFSRDHPRVVEMRLRHLADMHMTVGDPPHAITVLQEAVAECPLACPWALKDLFDDYLQSGRFAEGETYFRGFVLMHPEQVDAPDYLARLRDARSAPRPNPPGPTP